MGNTKLMQFFIFATQLRCKDHEQCLNIITMTSTFKRGYPGAYLSQTPIGCWLSSALNSANRQFDHRYLFWRDQTGNTIKCNVLLQNTMIEFIVCCTLTKYNNMLKCEVESFIFPSTEHLSSFVSQNNDLVRQCLLRSVLNGFVSPLKTNKCRNLSIWSKMADFNVFRIYIYYNQEFHLG